MLCLHDSIRHDDPAVQRLLRAVEDAPSLTAVILAAWQVARVLTVHLVEAVLADSFGTLGEGVQKRPAFSLLCQPSPN